VGTNSLVYIRAAHTLCLLWITMHLFMVNSTVSLINIEIVVESPLNVKSAAVETTRNYQSHQESVVLKYKD
jgi:hypothetical protein